jgi:hypothetical protein
VDHDEQHFVVLGPRRDGGAVARARRPPDAIGDASSPKIAGTDVLHREIEIVDGRHDAGQRCLGIGLHDPRHALQGQAGGEQALDHRVVQIPRDPLTLLEQREALDPGLQPHVLDGDRGCGGQADRELLIDVRERVCRGLVRQVEVSEHVAAHPDRNPQERPHRRVVGWEPEAVGVILQVG